MRVSVVIPTYNRAALLPETLRAVLAQSRSADEVLVVDDGSTDDTPAILRRYAPRVQSLRITNSGDLAARNVGVRAASGELVAFCDSDDLWRPGYLEAMAAFWRLEPSTRCAYADFSTFTESNWSSTSKFAVTPTAFWRGLRTGSGRHSWFDEPIFERLISFQPFFPSCMVVQREFFLSVGGWDEAVSRIVGTDFATALRMAEHTPLGVLLGPPLVGIRKHQGGFSADVLAMNLGDARVLDHVLSARPSLEPYADLVRESIVERRTAALGTAFARGDFDTVREIAALLPPGRQSLQTRLKTWVSGRPNAVRWAMAKGLLTAGSIAAHLR